MAIKRRGLPSENISSHSLKTRDQVRNLGVLMDSDLTFSSHIKSITKTAFYQLKNISRVKGFMSQTDQEKLIHAFISSRLDYCNSLLTGLPQKSIKQLQLIQNAAAQVLTRTKRSEHITPVLKSLHWLPVSYRIDFKVLLLVYKSLNGLGPEYMNDILVEYKPSRALRSTDSGQTPPSCSKFIWQPGGSSTAPSAFWCLKHKISQTYHSVRGGVGSRATMTAIV